jgi:hypothetical protein
LKIYDDFTHFQKDCQENKDLEIRFEKFKEFATMLEKPEAARRFLMFEKGYSNFIENGGGPILKWLTENVHLMTKMNLDKVDKETVQFLQQHPHLALQKNLDRIKFAINNPALIKPEVLNALEVIKNANITIQIVQDKSNDTKNDSQNFI